MRIRARKGLLSIILSVIVLAIYLVTNNQNLFNQADSKKTATPSTQQVENSPVVGTPGDQTLFLVTKVVDGDTIEIEGGQKVRYIGIDTPETVDPRKTVQCFGKEASAKNKELVEGKRVRLIKDVSETDKYGRLLRYVYIDDIFVNDYLVKEGYARASSYPPDVAFQTQFTASQKEAQSATKGLWNGCDASVQGVQSSSNYTLSPAN